MDENIMLDAHDYIPPEKEEHVDKLVNPTAAASRLSDRKLEKEFDKELKKIQ